MGLFSQKDLIEALEKAERRIKREKKKKRKKNYLEIKMKYNRQINYKVISKFTFWRLLLK